MHLGKAAICVLSALLATVLPAGAQDRAYLVTYDHYLEEPGSLEVEYFSTLGTQRAGNNFHAFWAEFEYGIKAWWTAEFYLDGQTTFGQSTLFTGWRCENRLRPLAREHWINPIIYLEYEHIKDSDKILKEVEGHDRESDYATSNAIANRELKHELEIKLLLSSQVKGWNLAVNPLAAKALSPSAPWEFGYALGASRPLAFKARAERCNLCPENFIVGAELYGGLGDARNFGLHQTSHYLAPVAAWNLPSGWTVRLSPGFGLNDNSHQFLLRWGVSREFAGFSQTVRRWMAGRQ